jgi:predicted transcriptional regulator
MKRDQRAYLANYYQRNRAAIRRKQREAYEAKYEYVCAELLAHLRLPMNSSHATESDTNCAECERLGPVKAAACLECGRAGFAQLSIHLGEAHKITRDDYLAKWNMPRATSLTSPEFRATKARPKNLRGGRRFTSESARRVNLGRRWSLRQPRSVEAERAGPRPTALSRRLGRSPVSDWAIAERRLRGMENKDIAAHLRISPALVSRRCRKMNFPPGDPVRFWHGEPVTDRQLRALLTDGALTVRAAAQRMIVKPHRISRALARSGQPLPFDLAEKVVREFARLKEALLGPSKLLGHEREELHWKPTVLRREIRALHGELKAYSTMTQTKEALCRLVRHGRASTLFRWSREFLAWLSEQYDDSDTDVRPMLSRAFEVVRDFLAHEYGVSSETLRRTTLRRETVTSSQETLRQRRALLDLRTVFGNESKIPTADLLSQLKRVGHAPWTKLGSEKRLGRILSSLGMKSRNIWMGDGKVLKGYLRDDLRVYSTAEVARLLGVAMITMKHYVWKKTIPLPPLIERIGARGAGRVRLWTEQDVEAAKRSLNLRAPKHRRPRQSARHSR